MNVAIIGSGGREHAIYWKLSQSLPETHIFVIPGNGGIFNSVPLNVNDFNSIKEFCEKEDIELIIVGPEDPLANGIADYFSDTNIKVFGPSKKASVLESSKIKAKKFMSKYGVTTAPFWIIERVKDSARIIDDLKGQLVVKYDGLAGGKGVYVCSSIKEANQAVDELIQKYGENVKFLIEEKLNGSEMSIIGFTDGKSIKLLSPSQDHKQLKENDKGPNTGGMGAYCPVTFCNENIMKAITKNVVEPTLRGIQAEGYDYKGIIYFGLMITDNTPYVLEYNIRLGDPETEVVLPAMKSNLLNLILSCFDGSLNDSNIEFNDGYFVDVVLVSGGYPKKYKKGYEIKGLKKLNKDTLVFHAGTQSEEGQLLTAGGRVLNIVVNEDTLIDAINKVYSECKKIHFKDIYYRKDIGKRNL